MQSVQCRGRKPYVEGTEWYVPSGVFPGSVIFSGVILGANLNRVAAVARKALKALSPRNPAARST